MAPMAIGMIETDGMVAMIAGADAAVKAAEVAV
ncbi:MAG: BMC domain-containing protein, partial [Alicyclobacillaceae bacterium]|nr:BMC domain-containing protein [Alicyclobacillaceae bacterium]